LAVNLSDLAAMGASPRAALLSLALPPSLDVGDFEQLVDGVLAVAATHRVTLIGGNITQTSGPLTVDITAIGSVRPRKTLTRAGARPGDAVYVTGSLGEAAVGLQRLRTEHAAPKLREDGCEALASPTGRRLQLRSSISISGSTVCSIRKCRSIRARPACPKRNRNAGSRSNCSSA